jgi:hypothetical protein
MKRFYFKMLFLAWFIPGISIGKVTKSVEADKPLVADSVVFIANITEIPQKESYELSIVLPPYDRDMGTYNGRNATLWYTTTKDNVVPKFAYLNKSITTLLTGGLFGDDAKYVLPIQLNPGDVIELKKSCAYPKRVEITRNGRVDENPLSSFIEVYERIQSIAKQNNTSWNDFIGALQQIDKEYRDKPGYASIDKKLWNGLLQSALLESCQKRDEQRGITLLEPETTSALRYMANHQVPEEGIESNALFLNVLRNTFNAIARNEAPKSRDWSYAAFVNTLRSVCLGDNGEGINAFGQYLLAYALPDLCLHEAEIVEAQKQYNNLFTTSGTKTLWSNTINALLTGKNGTAYPELLKLSTVTSIRKRHATPYTTIFFFPANGRAKARLSSLHNIVRDFKENANIALVYACVSDKSEGDKTVQELKAKCGGNDFVVLTPDEYEKICRIAGGNKKIPAITLDKKGKVLTRAIDDRYGEFYFREDLNALLNK